MIYEIKRYMIEEGVLQHVKDNIGKYALGGAAAAYAGAGEMGEDVSKMTNSIGNTIKNVGSDMGNSLVNSTTRTVEHYTGDQADSKPETPSPKPGVADPLVTDDNGRVFDKNKLVLDNPKDYTEKGTFMDTKHSFTPQYSQTTGKFDGTVGDTEMSFTNTSKYAAGGLAAATLAGGAFVGGKRVRRK